MTATCSLLLRRAGRLWAFGAACVLGSAMPQWLAAQDNGVSLGIAAAQVRFADESAFTSFSITPGLSVSGRSTLLRIAATATRVGTLGWSQQGSATGSYFSPVSERGLMLEASATAGGTSFPGGFSTGQATGALRAHRLGARNSGWLGASVGSMYDGSDWRLVAQGELGATASALTRSASMVLSPTRVGDSIEFLDVSLLYSTAFGAWDVALSLGGRAGAALPIVGGDERLWGGAMLERWIAPRRAIVLSAGTYPVDATQGFPAGRYFSAGLKLGQLRSLRNATQAEARQTRRVAAREGVREFSLTRTDDGSIAVAVLAPGAERVELTGDLTRWRAVTLTRGSGGRWWGRFDAGDASVAELTIRVDGGPWLVPPGAIALRDEFGGISGRITLPPPR